MQRLLKVASYDRSGKMNWLSWEKIPSVLYYKKLYKTNPEYFTEENGEIYLTGEDSYTINRCETLYKSCIQITGSNYALALALCDGDRRSENFSDIHHALKNEAFTDRLTWMQRFEDYIKAHGHKVGMVTDGHICWIDVSETLGLKVTTAKGYYSERPQLFEEINNVLFFLPTQNILIEGMFFRCCELAGSEYKLAVDLSTDRLTKERHLKNFERMTFKHSENFKCYSMLFSNYLDRNRTLFEEELIDV